MSEPCSEEELAARARLKKVIKQRPPFAVFGQDYIDDMRALLAELDRLRAENAAGRSTPGEIEDCAHFWDSRGQLWCYSEPADVWSMREQPTPAAMTAPYSARSYQRLVAEFGPLRALLAKDDGA
jgi:hypothetical protein